MTAPKTFRKKPVEIEAMQWTRDIARRPLMDFTNELVQLDDVEDAFRVFDILHNTWVSFEYGDWIIRGVKGEFYPCKNDVFLATYDEVTT